MTESPYRYFVVGPERTHKFRLIDNARRAAMQIMKEIPSRNWVYYTNGSVAGKLWYVDILGGYVYVDSKSGRGYLLNKDGSIKERVE